MTAMNYNKVFLDTVIFIYLLENNFEYLCTELNISFLSFPRLGAYAAA
jgi:hypothetical protein